MVLILLPCFQGDEMSQSLEHQLSEAASRLRNLIFDSLKPNNFEYTDCDSDLKIPSVKSVYNDLKKPFSLPSLKVEIPNFIPSELLFYKDGYVSVIYDTPYTKKVKSSDKQLRANHVYESRTSVDDIIDFVVTKYSIPNEPATNVDEEERIYKKKRKKKESKEKEGHRFKYMDHISTRELLVKKKLESEDVDIFKPKMSYHSTAVDKKKPIVSRDVDRESVNTDIVESKSELPVNASVQGSGAKEENETLKEGIESILLEPEKCQAQETKVDNIMNDLQVSAEKMLSVTVDSNSPLPIIIQDSVPNELVTDVDEEEWISKKKRKKKEYKEKERRRFKSDESTRALLVNKKVRSEVVGVIKPKMPSQSTADNKNEPIVSGNVDGKIIETGTVDSKSEIRIDASVEENSAKEENETLKVGIGSILSYSEKCQAENTKLDEIINDPQDPAEKILPLTVDSNSPLPINLQDEWSGESKSVTEEPTCVLNDRTSDDDALDFVVTKCSSPIELGKYVDMEKGNLQKRKEPEELKIVNNLPESKLRKSLSEESPKNGFGGEGVSLIVDKSIALMQEKLRDKDSSDVECEPICLQGNNVSEQKCTVMMLEKSKPEESRANEILSDLRDFAEKAFSQVCANESSSSIEFELDLSDKAKVGNIELEHKERLSTLIIRDSTGTEETISTPKLSSFQSVAETESCTITSNLSPLANDHNTVLQSETILKDITIEDQSVKTEITGQSNSLTPSLLSETQEAKENKELEGNKKLKTLALSDVNDIGESQELTDCKSSVEFSVNSSNTVLAVSDSYPVSQSKPVLEDSTVEDQSGRIEAVSRLGAKTVSPVAESEEAKENRELSYCLELVETSSELKKELSSIYGMNSTATCGTLRKKGMLEEVKHLLSCKVKLHRLSKRDIKKYTKKQVKNVSTPLGRLERELFQYSVEGEALSSDDSFEKKKIKDHGINENIKPKKEGGDTKKNDFSGKSEDLGRKKDSKSKDWKRIKPKNDLEIEGKKKEKIGLEKKKLEDETLSKIYRSANEFKAFKIPKEPTPKKIGHKASILSKPEEKDMLPRKEYKLLKSDKDAQSLREKFSKKSVPVNIVVPLSEGNFEKGKEEHSDSNKRKEFNSMKNYEKPRNPQENSRYIGEQLKDKHKFIENDQNVKKEKGLHNLTLNKKFAKDTQLRSDHFDHRLAMLPKHQLHGQQTKKSFFDSTKTSVLEGDGHYEDYDFDYLEEKLSAYLNIPYTQEKEDRLQRQVLFKRYESGTPAGRAIENQSLSLTGGKEITRFKRKSQNPNSIEDSSTSIPCSYSSILLKGRELQLDTKISDEDSDRQFRASGKPPEELSSDLIQISAKNEKVDTIKQPLCDNTRPTKKRKTLLLDPCVVFEAAPEANLTSRSSIEFEHFSSKGNFSSDIRNIDSVQKKTLEGVNNSKSLHSNRKSLCSQSASDLAEGYGNSSHLVCTNNGADTQVNSFKVKGSSSDKVSVAKPPQNYENLNSACKKLISMLKFPTNEGDSTTSNEKKDDSVAQLPDTADSVNEKCCTWITERVPCNDIQDVHDPEAMDEQLEKEWEKGDGDLYSIISSSLSISASRVGLLDEEDDSKEKTCFSGPKEYSEVGAYMKTSDFSRVDASKSSENESECEILKKAQQKLALLAYDHSENAENEEDLEAVEALFKMVENYGKQPETETKDFEAPRSNISSVLKNDDSSILQVQSQYAAYQYAAYLQNYYTQLQAANYLTPLVQAMNSSCSNTVSYPPNISGTKSATGSNASGISAQMNLDHSSSAMNVPTPSFVPPPPPST